jgi:drug/metabolite transporter superfamily protein YnfA
MNGRIQVDAFSYLVKLLHSNAQGVVFAAHGHSPFLTFA